MGCLGLGTSDHIASANEFYSRWLPLCMSRKIQGRGPTHYIGESPSNDGVIVVDGNV
jgi:hypothetical protein